MVGREPSPTAGAEPAEIDDDGPIGVFPSWRALYTTVVVYAIGLILVFYVLSSVLDFSGS